MSSLLKCSRNLKQRLNKVHRVSILAFVDFLLLNICSVKYSIWLKVIGKMQSAHGVRMESWPLHLKILDPSKNLTENPGFAFMQKVIRVRRSST